ncbi:MAG: protein kinase [Candidatus Wallbacteria bacterium]|nr:protein kinase [Candidatus Wallbacteria bacterium]
MIWALLRVVYIAYFSSESGEKSEDEVFENAGVFYHKGQYDDVIFLCRKYLKQTPSPKIRQLLARSLEKLERDDEALEIYEELYELQIDDENILQEYGDLLKKCGRTEEAFSLYLELILHDPENRIAFARAGEIVSKLPAGNPKIEKYFTQLFRFQPERLTDLENKPVEDELLIMQGLRFLREEKATQRLAGLMEKLEQTAGLSDNVRRVVGNNLVQSGEFLRAGRMLTPLCETGDERALLAELLQRKISPPEHQFFHQDLKSVETLLERLGLAQCIVPWWEEYWRRHPSDFHPCRKLLAHMFECGDTERPLEFIRQILQKSPEHREELLLWAEKFYRRSLSPTALMLFKELQKTGIEARQVLSKMEQEYEANKENSGFLEKYYHELRNAHFYEKAARIADKLIALVPDNSDYLLFHLEISLLQNNIPRVEKLMDQWAQENPEALKSGLELCVKAFEKGMDEPLLAAKVLEFGTSIWDRETALKQADFFAVRFPGTFRVKLFAGGIFLQKGVYDKCAQLLQSEKSDNESEENHRALLVAAALAGMRLFNPAKSMLATVSLQAVPFGMVKELLLMIGDLFYQAGHFEDAKDCFERLAEIDATFGNIHARLAEINEKIKKQRRGENLSPGISARFEEIIEIGRGGMGAVYKAWDSKLKREVALKVMNESLISDKKALKRFLTRDGAIARGLSHQGIVKVFDVVEDEVPFLVMEFVNGKSLRGLIEKRVRLSWKFYRAIFKQVLDALEYAHGKDVIHRDIKPDNIMLTPQGGTKIMDFGLAKMLDVTTLTEAGESLGTPLYMPPEQLKGEDLDQRADIYSAGATFYELLSFTLPFPAKDIESLLYMIFREDPKKLSEIDSSIGDGVSSAICRALSKKREDRFTTAGEFLTELNRVVPKG